MIDKVKEFDHIQYVDLAFEIDQDGSCLPRDPRGYLVGPGPEDSEVDKYLQTLVRWNTQCTMHARDGLV
jgi:hypothetical protein